jgi:hypothetical protein
MDILLRAFLPKKNSRRDLDEHLYRSGSCRFQKSDPDPVQNRPDPQHCRMTVPGTIEEAGDGSVTRTRC